MSFGFVASRRDGQHYELARFAVGKLKKVNLQLKGKSEREYEQAVVAYLQASNKLRNNLITQVCDDEVEKISRAEVFGFKHKPDVTIGKDGTAIEIKTITSGYSVRDLLGQGLVYRTYYRFVILVLVDNTPDRQIVELCSKKGSAESAIFQELAEEHNIFTIVGPKKMSQNIAFLPAAVAEKEVDDDPIPAPPVAEEAAEVSGNGKEVGDVEEVKAKGN